MYHDGQTWLTVKPDVLMTYSQSHAVNNVLETCMIGQFVVLLTGMTCRIQYPLSLVWGTDPDCEMSALSNPSRKPLHAFPILPHAL